MASGEYLIAAHTNDDLDLFTTADVPASQVGSQRWTRTWKVDETGEVGTTNLVFYLAGGNNFGLSSTYKLLVDNTTQDGNFSDATVISGVYNAGAQTMTFNTNLNDGDIFSFCGFEQILTIHSINSGPWSIPTTWDCTCVPTANDSVYIDPATNVTVDIAAEAAYLSVESGGTLTMTTPESITLGGNLDILGSVIITAGEITLIEHLNQVVNAGGNTVDLFDIEINKSGGSSVTFTNGTYVLNGTLYPTMGDIIMDAAPTQFIVNSISGVGGARIAAVSSSSITGNVTVRRYIEPGVEIGVALRLL
ncbi:MAG: hypothetical protein IPO32_05410 [Crocinitomicaceae bacterium]|nr:hypothetical protein [Crocinitomicaceae bacterium]